MITTLTTSDTNHGFDWKGDYSPDRDDADWTIEQLNDREAVINWVGAGFCGCRCIMVIDGKLYDNMQKGQNYPKEWVDLYEDYMNNMNKRR